MDLETIGIQIHGEWSWDRSPTRKCDRGQLLKQVDDIRIVYPLDPSLCVALEETGSCVVVGRHDRKAMESVKSMPRDGDLEKHWQKRLENDCL
jgi:hypothetical protein